MPMEALTFPEKHGDTALHTVGTVGNTRAIVVLVQKNPDLLYIRGMIDHVSMPFSNENAIRLVNHAINSGFYGKLSAPLCCLYACKDTLLYLLTVTKDDHVSMPFSNENAIRRVNHAINSGLYGPYINDMRSTSKESWSDAKDVIGKLANMAAGIKDNNLEGMKDEYWRYIPLLKAALRSDWDAAKRFFVKDEIVITYVSETVLHITVENGERAIHFIGEVGGVDAGGGLDIAGKICTQRRLGRSNTRAAVVLVQKNPDLLYIRGYVDDRLPLHCAALYACKDTLLYLLTVTKDDHVSMPFSNENAIRLVNHATNFGFYGKSPKLYKKFTA
ncbi:hypothetical protein RHSIM_Rhsim05G0147400 [Rhododendron simsii]|uniref:Uncharacterized protein n=1 Tax=Rhododendron simsii TaxID=118357 RepID=A0A834GVI6_RHOSS|nr:hypothetical protein RHSIM_Rhsim05G0147400 [Rhododendron simsii]